MDAAKLLRSLWSLPRVKLADFDTGFDLAKSRLRTIAKEIGFDDDVILGT
jgi:hypothetical protein